MQHFAAGRLEALGPGERILLNLRNENAETNFIYFTAAKRGSSKTKKKSNEGAAPVWLLDLDVQLETSSGGTYGPPDCMGLRG